MAYLSPKIRAPLTVVETPVFVADAERLLTEEERSRLVWHVAMRPEDGDLIPGTGGARKHRWARAGMGKLGGVRVITFFHDREMPLFLLNMFSKNERIDLSQDERNGLRTTLKTLVSEYKKRARS
jgi:hypothetical protein